jgi:hypothetical protein
MRQLPCRARPDVSSWVWLPVIALAALGCTSVGKAPEPKECDPECQDQVAVRALREAMKLVYNLTLQGGPVGAQDASTDCPQGGRARVFGYATSNELQGATEVELTYTFTACSYRRVDETAEENYDITVRGSVAQTGTLAVQPTATTALILNSDQISIEGSLYDPALDYRAEACELELAQDGNELFGTLCGRPVGVDL